MIININKRWRLKSDRYCWAVQELCVTKSGAVLTDKWGKPKYLPRLYYTGLTEATRGLSDLNLRLSDAEGLEAAIKEAEEFGQVLAKALEVRAG